MPERVAVIGAGIVGLAHAWREAAHGARVTLFERDRRAEGASVRNFGLVWPIGQAPEWIDAALESRAFWEEFLAATGGWRSHAGSLFVATREDEWRVLSEFADGARERGYRCRLVNAAEARRLSPAVDRPDLLGGLHSETEIGVDPREAISAFPQWLADLYGVELQFGVTVVDVAMPTVTAADGRSWDFDRVVVAGGADFQTLYPEAFRSHGLGRCKLQMMRTGPQPDGWRLGPTVASGLTLRHYPNFEVCPGHAHLRERIATETPELDRYGIHVMAAQNGLGEVVLGDSHEYDEDVTPFDKEEITGLILRELRKMIDLPDWGITARWSGVYSVRRGEPGIQFLHEPADGVTIVLAVGGCGMTMSFGLAERMVARRATGRQAAAAITT